MIPKSGHRFPACAKPSQSRVLSFHASAGEGRSEKIMLKQQTKAKYRINPKSFRFCGGNEAAAADLVANPALRAAAAHAHHCRHESPRSPGIVRSCAKWRQAHEQGRRTATAARRRDNDPAELSSRTRRR